MKNTNINKHMSVLGLFCRSTLWRLLAVSLLAIAAEVLMFLSELKNSAPVGIEACIQYSDIRWVLCVWYLLFLVILSLPGTDFGSKSIYTYRRLQISEKWVFVWQCIYNLLAFALLWMLQVVTAYGLCRLYTAMVPAEFVTQQSIFLAFYRSDLLHSILPLEETTRWAVNIFILISSAVSSAYFPFQNRRGSFAVSLVLEALIVIICFVRPLGNFGLLPLVLPFVAAVDLFMVFAWEEDDDDVQREVKQASDGAVI